MIEFIHTSTLLHDDVVDESDLRRGRKTANAWGTASVLVGDFLYSRSFQLMVELDRMAVMQVLANTTNAIAEGESRSSCVNNPDVDEAAYLRDRTQTAVLFAAATLWARCYDLDARHGAALHAYGLNLGYAFSRRRRARLHRRRGAGQNLGDDRRGKATCPIHAMSRADAATRQRLREIVQAGDAEAMPEVLAAIETAGSIAYSHQRAVDYADAAERALGTLPENAWTAALRGLARYAVDRDF